MLSSEETVTLRIEVRPSLETNDHEVLLFGDEQNLVDRFGNGSIGLDPDDLLAAPSPLLETGARECLIGRCDCGCIGCGDVHVRISTSEDLVRWSAVRGPRAPVYFRLERYNREIARALQDHSWETPERTTCRLIREGVDREALQQWGLTFSWASGRANRGAITVAFWLKPGPYQILVRMPWGQIDPPALAAEAMINFLAQPPSHWFDVVWHPQAGASGPPQLAGPGWRPWKR